MKASLLGETCQIANRPNPGGTPTLPDSFGLVRLLSLLQSASMRTGRNAARFRVGYRRGYRLQSPARCLIHSTIYERLRIRPGEPSRDVRGRPYTSSAQIESHTFKEHAASYRLTPLLTRVRPRTSRAVICWVSPALGGAYHFASPRSMSRRLIGASGERKSGIVSGVRLGRVRKATGHSVTRSCFTCTYCAGSSSEMYSR